MSTKLSLTIDEWLAQATSTLQSADIGTARLDCLILLEDLTGQDRSWLIAHPEHQLGKNKLIQLNRQLVKRCRHQPLAYIRHQTEFYGRTFYINQAVLQPRPESETMIDALRDLKLANDVVIADVGTGSGVLAITAKLELPNNQVLASDVDPRCLTVARRNARHYNAEIQFLKGDLLRPLASFRTMPVTLLCNLPYVPDSFRINRAALHEPKLAIYGGADGLDQYRKLFQQLGGFSGHLTTVLTESMPNQQQTLTDIAAKSDFKLVKTDDFIQVFSKNY